MRLRTLAFVTALVVLSPGSVRADDGSDFFEKKVRPVFVEHCYKCHSADAEKGKKLRGGLRLDTVAGIRKGGESGPLFVPGKPKAVRFWVGVESGQGSVKAKAEEETPNNWHVHPEIPNPLPAGSQFWVEIEPPTGEKLKTSFDFKK